MNILYFALANGVLLLGSSVNTASEARQLLVPQQHIANIGSASASPLFNYALFKEQRDAIVLLGNAGQPEDVNVLIPFLDYPGDGAYNQSSIPTISLQDTLRYWPAFAAIAHIPHSEDVLASYALNENNPLDYRLTVLQVLKYQSADTFNRCVQTLLQKDASNTKLIGYVNLIKRAPYSFRGFLSHKSLDLVLPKH